MTRNHPAGSRINNMARNKPRIVARSLVVTLTSVALVVVPLLAVTVAFGTGSSAAVASTAQSVLYRYWSYWTASASTWSFASVGASHRVVDGSVEGWRFGIQGQGSLLLSPRAEPSFAALCGGTAAPVGGIRVAVYVDYGLASSAPAGQAPPAGSTGTCAVLATSPFTGYAALASVTGLPRTDNGLVCAISGYPSGECAPIVPAPGSGSPSPTATIGASPSIQPTVPHASSSPTWSTSSASTGTAAAPPTSADGQGPGSGAASSSTGSTVVSGTTALTSETTPASRPPSSSTVNSSATAQSNTLGSTLRGSGPAGNELSGIVPAGSRASSSSSGASSSSSELAAPPLPPPTGGSPLGLLAGALLLVAGAVGVIISRKRFPGTGPRRAHG